ncbi:hypothetical protein ALT1644_340020 [Alteromonas macleodii]
MNHNLSLLYLIDLLRVIGRSRRNATPFNLQLLTLTKSHAIWR